MLTTHELEEVAEEAWEDIRATYPEWGLCEFAKVELVTKRTTRIGGSVLVHANGDVRLMLSTCLKDRLTADECVRHEVAHVVTWDAKDGDHGPTWKAAAVKCGAEPEACVAGIIDKAAHKYLIRCDECGHELGWERATARKKKILALIDFVACIECNTKGGYKRIR